MSTDRSPGAATVTDPGSLGLQPGLRLFKHELADQTLVLM
jgi:hypothetical protein